MKWQFINSPFFQLNYCFSGHRAIGNTTAHMMHFGLPPPPPPTGVYYKAFVLLIY
jgi:hypothetical protein